jgi:hypothetical protein
MLYGGYTPDYKHLQLLLQPRRSTRTTSQEHNAQLFLVLVPVNTIKHLITFIFLAVFHKRLKVPADTASTASQSNRADNQDKHWLAAQNLSLMVQGKLTSP